MKKRFWSMLLVLIIVLTMIPATAYEAAGTEQLMLRWPNMWNNNIPCEADDMGNYGFFNNEFIGAPGNKNSVFFHVVENGASVERVAGGAVTSSNPSVIRVSQNPQNGDATDIEVLGFGNATISYTTASGNTYSMPVSVILPDVGMYSAPVANQLNYITKFEVTDTADTFYILPSDNYTMTSITLTSQLDEIADVTFDPTNNYAMIKVTGTPNSNQFYQVCVDATHKNGNHDIIGRYYSVSLVNNKTSLLYCYPEYNNNIPQIPSNPYWQNSIFTWPGRSDNLIFALSQGGVAGNPITSISTSNPYVVSVYTEAGSDIVRIEAVGIGTANLTYTDGNNNTYTMPVTVDLPNVGAYTSKTPSANTLITDGFEFNAIGDEFYYIARNGYIFSKVDLCGGLGDIATVTLDSTNTIATIKINKVPLSGMNYFIEHYASTSNGWRDEGNLWIDIINNIPHLQYVYQDDTRYNEFDIIDAVAKGNKLEGWINRVDANSCYTVELADLKSSNEDVLIIYSANDPQNPDRAIFEIVGWGTAQILYTDDDGNVCTIDVISDFNNVSNAFFTDDSFKQENYIGTEYTVTNDTNVIYYMTNPDFTISNFELLYDTKDYATFKMIDDHCVEITISNKIKDYIAYGDTGEFVISYSETESNGQAYPMEMGLELTNKMCDHLTTELKDAKAPDCTTVGYTGDTICKQCEEVVAKGKDIPATGHTYKDGVCKDCGDKPVVADKVDKVDTTKPVDEVTPVIKQEAADTTAKDVSAVVDAILADNVTNEVKEAVSDETLKEIKEELEAGKQITTEIKAEVVDEKDLDADDVKEIKDKLGEAGKVAQFLDLSVMIKSVAADGAEKKLGTLNVLSEKITFTIMVPEELVKDGREFYVIRVHDGEAEKLELTKNADGTYSFETDRFSSYALAYDEAPVAGETPEVPKTGDATNVTLYIALFALGCVSFVIAKKKGLVY